MADAYGNALPFVSAAVTLEASGPAGIVGENPFPLVAGVGAVYLRAGRQPGRVKVAAATPRWRRRRRRSASGRTGAL